MFFLPLGSVSQGPGPMPLALLLVLGIVTFSERKTEKRMGREIHGEYVRTRLRAGLKAGF